jgi:hypothetical protein
MTRILLRLCLAATAAAAVPTAAADQSAQSAGAHELPAFVRERVELTPGATGETEPLAAGAHADALARTGRVAEGVVAR